ncbi:DUF924 family protein [Salinarimonas ramus]|uniref:DUF924 domain-containing protein n=1 Tax=Salinarimonas ramus TaxID=690164 RepID=A0A917Q5Q9_9HYPH|nr:DUF924 family protein [Salinarimonas ramus]GGK19215.1 hypothetical protein GCM10011322_02310 [Salinarimonas ramus]
MDRDAGGGPSAGEIVAFWRDAGPQKWFSKDEALDAEIRERFLSTYEAAAAGRLDEWELEPEGSLALLILLDQFPRNMFRGTKDVYRSDPQAVLLAERAIERGHDSAFDPPMCRFYYLPFQHAEDLAAQDRAIALNEAAGDEDGVKWARHHRDIIARFGRFPHRNAILGRETTPEEAAFLAESDFRG